MTNRTIRNITEKANGKIGKEMRKEVKAVIRTLKADIKRTAKSGASVFRIKIKNAEICERAAQYFKGKGFRCWKYTLSDAEYMAIEW